MQDSAALWRAALFTASITIRYAATSTAAGSGPISSSAATDQVIPVRPRWERDRQVVLVCPLPQGRHQAELVQGGWS